MRFCTNSQCQEIQPDKFSNEKHPVYLDSDGCRLITSIMGRDVFAQNRHYIVADQHFHLEAFWRGYEVLRLYRKSRILWWLPELPLGLVSDETFILSTDPSLVLPADGGWGTGP
ncbi:hypothetical protein BDW74DRAFT_123661 [Aspergillus multicolor]|uniref:uncharacterized protein n=1 Tax=Aspergillus multicolor TaxID=41759 RepID=UPI003CCDD3F6